MQEEVEVTEREKKYFQHVSKGFYVDQPLSDWIREKLPLPQDGYGVTDVDLALYNWRTRKFMLLEIKRKMFECKPAQRNFFAMLNKRLRATPTTDDFFYLGFHLITYENTFFHDGKVYLDHIEVSEQELIDFLSF